MPFSIILKFCVNFNLHYFVLICVLILKGSHGGRGGITSGSHLQKGEAVSYGNTKIPRDYGSGGGGPCGGSGGGVIVLRATDFIQVDGKVSANGVDGASGCGGGSGGSIYFDTVDMRGSGLIYARGGKGTENGGGGSGGRIAINYSGGKVFTGQILADGGLVGMFLHI